jgi:hypothetical protein
VGGVRILFLILPGMVYCEAGEPISSSASRISSKGVCEDVRSIDLDSSHGAGSYAVTFGPNRKSPLFSATSSSIAVCDD